MNAVPFTVAILAGGLATRLRPLTSDQPKALIRIAGKPFIQLQLELLMQKGVHRVVLCLGHMAESIVDVVEKNSGFGLEITYSCDGPVPLGTGGSIRKAVPLLPDTFLVLYGDSYLDCDYNGIAGHFLEIPEPALMTVYRNEDQWDQSNVEFWDGRILAYNKTARTPSMKYIDYGLGAFRKSVFDALPENTPLDLASIYQDLVRANLLAGIEVFQRFYEIGSQKGIEEFQRYFEQRSTL
jgi:NDP-sugar pyrophosphorylase family protein